MHAIEISQLNKWYESTHILKDLSFSVKEGEFFGFIGPNGAGKTTTINCIDGLATFQSGKIEIFGHNVISDYRQTRSLIGLSQQDYNFDTFFNVEQILYYQGGFFGLSGDILKKRVEDVLHKLKLSDKRKEDTFKLSGGMKRRLMLAKALISNPRILILDEPTAGVDVELRLELWNFLCQLNREGVTILLTTHYIEEAEQLCDRIGIISRGEIVELDSTRNLKRKYSQNFIEIETDSDLSKLPPKILDFKYEVLDSLLRIKCQNCPVDIGPVIEELRRNDIAINRLRINEASLESIYLDLTS